MMDKENMCQFPDIPDNENSKEARYVQARIPGTTTRIEYDRVTMKLSYHVPLAQWKDCEDHEYTNE